MRHNQSENVSVEKNCFYCMSAGINGYIFSQQWGWVCFVTPPEIIRAQLMLTNNSVARDTFHFLLELARQPMKSITQKYNAHTLKKKKKNPSLIAVWCFSSAEQKWPEFKAKFVWGPLLTAEAQLKLNWKEIFRRKHLKDKWKKGNHCIIWQC